ncbi:DAK2 domain-containing protein, partial [Kitasatospora sp. NPDC059803]|uniref:DAK2 domain-containing protein n=1 Tax=Kitasatospora sp. NPDC059803 TaxID=3346953 RepID=UPI00365039AC
MTGTKAFDGVFTAGWMRRFAETVAVTEEELTRLDQAAGDGDFGVNLLTGVRCALAALDRLPPGRQAAAVPLGAAAGAFLDEVGGTSGPLFGLVLQELAAAVGAGPLTGPALARGVTAALEAVQRVGEAGAGGETPRGPPRPPPPPPPPRPPPPPPPPRPRPPPPPPAP